MAINYKLYKANRKDKFNGKWYARAQHNGTVGTSQLAEIIQQNCTVKKSDVVAVLTELVEVMTTQLQNSQRVKLDGFGSFKIGMATTPADSAKLFSVSKNVKSVHVLFQPEVKISADGSRTRTFLSGLKLVEAQEYDVDKETDTDSQTLAN